MEFECEHREEIKRTELCQLCGMSGKTLPVYGCKLHGECTIHAGGIRKEGKNNLPLLPVCISCPDRTSAKDEPPKTVIPPKIPKIVNPKEIGIGKLKKALKDKNFRNSLPASLQPDVEKYLQNPGCGCHTPFFKKLLDTAGKHLSEYYKEDFNKETVEKELIESEQKRLSQPNRNPLACSHRKEIIRTETNNAGKKIDIYKCDILEECTMFVSGIHQNNKTELPLLQACVFCPHRNTFKAMASSEPETRIIPAIIPTDPEIAKKAVEEKESYITLINNITEEQENLEFFVKEDINKQMIVLSKYGQITAKDAKNAKENAKKEKPIEKKHSDIINELLIKGEQPDILKLRKFDREIEKKLKESEYLKKLINVDHNKQITYLSAQATACNAYFENCCKCCGCCLWIKYHGSNYDGALLGPITVASSNTSNNINLGINPQTGFLYTTQVLDSQSVTFTTGTDVTWTVPDGYNTLKIEVWGGGGAGAPGRKDGGGGGGAGGYTSTQICAIGTRTQVSVTYTVGGAGGTSTVNCSSPSLALSATGGQSATGDAGGLPGYGNGGNINLGGFEGQTHNGLDGGDGGHLSSQGYSNIIYGNGGYGGSGTHGHDGTAPGGGGGGGAAHKNGGAGTPGQVKFTYSQVVTVQVQLGFSIFTATITYPNCPNPQVVYATNNGQYLPPPSVGGVVGMSVPTSPDGCYSSWTQGACCGNWILPFYETTNGYTVNTTCPQPTGYPDSLEIIIGNCKGQAQSNEPVANLCRDNICCDTWTAYIPNIISLQANGYNFNPEAATEYQIVNFTRGDSDCNGLWQGDTGGWQLLFHQSPTSTTPIAAYLINTLNASYSGNTSGSIEVELVATNVFNQQPVNCTSVNQWTLFAQSVDSNCALPIPNLHAYIYYDVTTQNRQPCPGGSYYTTDGTTTTTLTAAYVEIPLFAACYPPQCAFTIIDVTEGTAYISFAYYGDEFKFITFPTFDPVILNGPNLLNCSTNQTTVPSLSWSYYVYGYYGSFSLGVSFEWDFGDGSTSSDPNPTHSYSDPGDRFVSTTYTIKLTVTSATGVTNTCSRIMTVYPKCCPVCYSFDWPQIQGLPVCSTPPCPNQEIVGVYSNYAYEQTFNWSNYIEASYGYYGLMQQVSYSCSGTGGCYFLAELSLNYNGDCTLFLGTNSGYNEQFVPKLLYTCNDFKCDSGGTFSLYSGISTYCSYYEGENYCGPFQNDPVLSQYVPNSIDITTTQCSLSETSQECCPSPPSCACGICFAADMVTVNVPTVPASVFPINCPPGCTCPSPCCGGGPFTYFCCCGNWNFLADCPYWLDPPTILWQTVTGAFQMPKSSVSRPFFNVGCCYLAPTGVYIPIEYAGVYTDEWEMWLYLIKIPVGSVSDWAVGYWPDRGSVGLFDSDGNVLTTEAIAGLACAWVLFLDIPPDGLSVGGHAASTDGCYTGWCTHFNSAGVLGIGWTTLDDYNNGNCIPQNIRAVYSDYAGCGHGCDPCQSCCTPPGPACNFFDPPGCNVPLVIQYTVSI